MNPETLTLFIFTIDIKLPGMIDAKDWIDITLSLQNGMVNWPGDPSFHIEFFSSLKNDGVNISFFSTCSHIGTHVDAPLHYIDDANDVTAIPLDCIMGRVKVFYIGNELEISLQDISRLNINKGDRIIFKTKNSESEWILKPFNEKFIALSTEAGKYLKEKQIRFVGIDYLSISQMQNSKEVHQLLLSSGICIVEGLDLRFVEPGEYEMICLPMKIKNAEGAPARVLIRPVIVIK